MPSPQVTTAELTIVTGGTTSSALSNQPGRILIGTTRTSGSDSVNIQYSHDQTNWVTGEVHLNSEATHAQVPRANAVWKLQPRYFRLSTGAAVAADTTIRFHFIDIGWLNEVAGAVSTLSVADASTLLTKTWAAPAAIGSSTPDAGTFTTLQANTSLKVNSSGVAVTKILSASATLDFDLSTATYQDLTITVTGAAAGDAVFLAAPHSSVANGVVFFAWVSAANTVTVRAATVTGTPNPAAGTFTAFVISTA